MVAMRGAIIPAAAIIWNLAVPVGCGAADAPFSAQHVAAFARFDDAPESYAGRRYVWLGRHELRIGIDVRPAPGHIVELLWGAKNDQRAAELTINGRRMTLTGGGYDGFRPLGVAVPRDIAGERYELLLRASDAGRPAFIAEVRLLTEDRSVPATAPTGATWKTTFAFVPTTMPISTAQAEAFPHMRALWDRTPATRPVDHPRESMYRQAEGNARLAAEALYRCRRFVDGWLAHADARSGLIPRNLRESRHFWNAKDSAADNYPFMVLTAALTDRALFEGRMLDMLRAEMRLTSRLDSLPDDFAFTTQTFLSPRVNLENVIFGAAEYVKDGLLPLTEWLGPSPWSGRAVQLIDDVWKHASIDTPFGRIPTRNVEVNGDLLQACSRLFWFTGDRKYLDWAIRLGDYYLLGDQHPTRNMKELRLVDHGCEVINGLSELYAAVHFAAPEKKKAYEKPIHEMLRRILEVGRNEHGLLYTAIDPVAGTHRGGLCDTWGYDYDAFYTVWLIDGTDDYRQAVRKVLSGLDPHAFGLWRDMDSLADAIEGALNLYNREPVPQAASWIDREIRSMWRIQKSDGVIEGWHGDGNFARTSIMYALWKTQGLTARPWRPDLRLGAVRDGEALLISLAADKDWSGTLVFDRARHKQIMRLPLDYPRINQFPEWFTVEPEAWYELDGRRIRGAELAAGVNIRVPGGQELRLYVKPMPAAP